MVKVLTTYTSNKWFEIFHFEQSFERSMEMKIKIN
jgi:hypothetical protein